MSIEFTEDIKAAADRLRQVVPLMVQRNIPTNPGNFALWYAYAKQDNPELCAALDKHFPAGGKYNAQLSEQLFRQFFINKYLSEKSSTRERLLAGLNSFYDNVGKASELTSSFGESLRTNIAKIAQSEDEAEVQRTLVELLSGANMLENFATLFRNELDLVRAEISSFIGRPTLNGGPELEAVIAAELDPVTLDSDLDDLTGVMKREPFERRLTEVLGSETNAVYLLLMNLDNFRKPNQAYGEETGDCALKAIGGLLGSFIADHVLVARYAGDEFAVLCYDESQDYITRLAEKIRRRMGELTIKQANSEKRIESITISVGLAQAEADDTLEVLVERATMALKAAKQRGRNQVLSAADLANEENEQDQENEQGQGNEENQGNEESRDAERTIQETEVPRESDGDSPDEAVFAPA